MFHQTSLSLLRFHTVSFFLRNEDEMYKILLNDYEYRQKQILMENAELKKVLQQMKKEMIFDIKFLGKFIFPDSTNVYKVPLLYVFSHFKN